MSRARRAKNSNTTALFVCQYLSDKNTTFFAKKHIYLRAQTDMTNQAIKKEINQIAKEYGFDKAVFRCKWLDCDIYDVAFNDASKVAYIGQPILIIVYKNTARVAMQSEVDAIFASEK